MAIHDAGFERPFLELDGEAYVAVLASPLFYELAAAVADPSLVVVADLPVEWDGSFDLLFQWFEVQRLRDELLFTWDEIAAAGILNNALPFTWNELDTVAPLSFTWTELPAGLLDAYELDPQRPYGRMTKPA